MVLSVAVRSAKKLINIYSLEMPNLYLGINQLLDLHHINVAFHDTQKDM